MAGITPKQYKLRRARLYVAAVKDAERVLKSLRSPIAQVVRRYSAALRKLNRQGVSLGRVLENETFGPLSWVDRAPATEFVTDLKAALDAQANNLAAWQEEAHSVCSELSKQRVRRPRLERIEAKQAKKLERAAARRKKSG